MLKVGLVILEALLVFILVFLVQLIFGTLVNKKLNKRTSVKKLPNNIKYLVYRYKINLKLLDLNVLYRLLLLADSFIITFIYMITTLVENFYIRFAIAFIFYFPVFVFVYHLIGTNILKKENEQNGI